MPYSPLFTLGSFDELPPARKCRLVLGLVRALVEIDVEYLLQHPETPPLYQSGVVYRPQQSVQGSATPGLDHWWDVPTCRAAGEGSCEDLASWRVAELRLAGYEHVRPFVHSKVAPGGMTIYHIVVMTPDGEEDPSKALGMGDW